MHKLEALNLKKTIKKTRIINDVSITIQSGEIIGLLGPNGAGKTTTLPQESSIFKDLSVEENLLLAAQISFPDKKQMMEKTNEMLELLNISHIKDRKGVSLSGGERRRCEIARSLIITPKFLLLDEPFAGVDPIAVADIQNIIRDLKKLNIGILITDHNVRETLAICDRGYVMKDGEILCSGTAEEISQNEQVRKHYLGDGFKFDA